MKYRELLSTGDIIHLLTNKLNLKLKAQGGSVFFLCPFHPDHSPSFSFSPNHKLFKCFSCSNFNQGRAGHFFLFWAEYRKITLEEALKEISDWGYFSLPKFNSDKKKEDEKQKEFFQLCSLVTDIYNYNLVSGGSFLVNQYLLRKRKLLPETIKSFSLGCTISKKQLTNLIFNDDLFSSFTQKMSSLWCINQEGEIQDFFAYPVLIIPLKNDSDQVVAWTARKITTIPEESKYICLPNYPGYKKSDILYNYSAVKKHQSPECFLVEGYFDVIHLTQAGVTNCLAVLGTTLSAKQLELLKTLERKIVLFLDNDEAGKEATITTIVNFLINQIDCEVVANSYPFKDPDEVCLNYAEVGIRETLNQRVNPYHFVIEYYYEKLLIRDNPQRTTLFIKKVTGIFKSCPFSRSFLIRRLKEITDLEAEEIAKFFSTIEYPLLTARHRNLDFYHDRVLAEKEEELLELCANNRKYWSFLFIENYSFATPGLREKYEKVNDYYLSSFKNINYKQDTTRGGDCFVSVNLDRIAFIFKQIRDLTLLRNSYEKNKKTLPPTRERAAPQN